MQSVNFELEIWEPVRVLRTTLLPPVRRLLVNVESKRVLSNNLLSVKVERSQVELFVSELVKVHRWAVDSPRKEPTRNRKNKVVVVMSHSAQ
ncbi:hypothetical protein, partial [Isoptericola croceus]|uniref:hypothetical protein n=1 Tax=Isoptericola croceus TaxID=3031406 RepID=UPI0023F757FA